MSSPDPRADSDRGPGLAVVVGGSRGIGLATACALAEAGWPTRVVARDRLGLDAASERAAHLGIHLETRQADATDPDQVRSALDPGDRPLTVCVAAVGKNLSRRLITAGRGGKPVRTHPLEEWDSVLEANLTSAFVVAREAAEVMVGQQEPAVLVTVGSATWRGAWGQSAYAACKAALVSLTRSWALELAEHDIRVVGVAPGVVQGQALRDTCAARPRHAEFMHELRQRVPLQRFAEEGEIAQAVLQLVANDYINGTVLEVHGGGFN